APEPARPRQLLPRRDPLRSAATDGREPPLACRLGASGGRRLAVEARPLPLPHRRSHQGAAPVGAAAGAAAPAAGGAGTPGRCTAIPGGAVSGRTASQRPEWMNHKDRVPAQRVMDTKKGRGWREASVVPLRFFVFCLSFVSLWFITCGCRDGR